eukprot:scaffold2011_cov233-Pinguiococcus_pyrenoidosus.AAC.3
MPQVSQGCVQCGRDLSDFPAASGAGKADAPGALADSGFELLEDYHGASPGVMDSVALFAKNAVNEQLRQKERLLEYAKGSVPKVTIMCIECSEQVLETARQELEQRRASLAQMSETKELLDSCNLASTLAQRRKDAREVEASVATLREELLEMEAELDELKAGEIELRAELSSEGILGDLDRRLRDHQWQAEHEIDYYYDLCSSLSHQIRFLSLSAEQMQADRVLSQLYAVRSTDDAFAINDYRLALSPTASEDGLQWPEINAAWGEAALLLYNAIQVVRLRPRKEVKYDHLGVVPMGRCSRIVSKLETCDAAQEVWPLYHQRGQGDERKAFEDAVLLFARILSEVVENSAAQFPIAPFGDDLRIAVEEVEAATSEQYAMGDVGVARQDLLHQIAKALKWLIESLP